MPHRVSRPRRVSALTTAAILAVAAAAGRAADNECAGCPPAFGFTTLTEPWAGADEVVAADLDGDGDLDALVARSTATVAWYENLGGGAFGPERIVYLYAGLVRGADAGDLDGDGDLDIVSIGVGDDELLWYENLGGGDFALPQSTPAATNGAGATVRVVDIDGDGDGDLLSTYPKDFVHYQPRIALSVNLGGGQFSPPSSIPGEGRSLDVADFDGDGDPDVLFAGDCALGWSENLGAGAFQEHVIHYDAPLGCIWYVGFFVCAAADVDGDGDLDAIASWEDWDLEVYRISWYENLGGGAFGPPRPVTTEALNTRSLVAADVDADGDLDVVAGSDSPALAWYENLGGGLFGPQEVLIGGHNMASDLAAADLDGDGRAEILIAKEAEGFVLGRTQEFGRFCCAAPLPGSPIDPRGLDAADLDGDGTPDLVVASSGDDTVAWYPNDGAGGFDVRTAITMNADGAVDVRAADLDQDGDADVLSASRDDDTIAWYPNVGGAFGAGHALSSAEDAAAAVFAADLDQDGDLDPIAVSAARVVWFENLGAATFATKTVAPTPNGRDVLAADLDQDGDDDVLSTHDGAIAWHENLGAGTFAGAKSIAAVAAQGACAVDLDGDGDLDLLVALPSSGATAWFENLGSGTFGPPTDLPAGPAAPQEVFATDADGDGDPDVFVAADGEVAWYENVGNAAFAPRQVLNAGTGDLSRGVHARDLDGDGDADVVSSSVAHDEVALYANRTLSGLGPGCAGSGGVVPTLAVSGATSVGADLTIAIDHGLGGSVAFLFLGLETAALPMGSGCTLRLAPLPAVIPVPLSAGGVGAGSAQIGAKIPPSTPSISFLLQAVIPDAGAPAGLSASGAVRIQVL